MNSSLATTTSPPSPAALLLADEIADAVLADEAGEGCDVSAGLFGPNLSALVRRLASPPDTLVSAPAKTAVVCGRLLDLADRLRKSVPHESTSRAEVGSVMSEVADELRAHVDCLESLPTTLVRGGYRHWDPERGRWHYHEEDPTQDCEPVYVILKPNGGG